MANIVVDTSKNVVTSYQRELNKIIDSYIPNLEQSQNIKLEITHVINKMYQEIIDIEMGIADCMLEKKEVIQHYPILYVAFDIENMNSDHVNKRTKILKDFINNISAYCSLSKSVYYDEIDSLNKEINNLLSKKSELFLLKTIAKEVNEFSQTREEKLKPKRKQAKTKDNPNEK